MKGLYNLYLILIIIFSSIATRLLFVFSIPIDSDEITWSIIGRRVFSGEDFHIFFLNQKYMGALEGYVVGAFQALFGYNLVTLRINSIIFGSLVAICVYLLLKKITNPIYAFAGALLLNFASYDVTSNFTKAWGNRPFISLTGLFILYLSWLIFLSKTKLSRLRMDLLSALTGFVLGFSFWANLETVYFILFVIGIFIIPCLKLPSLDGRWSFFHIQRDLRSKEFQQTTSVSWWLLIISILLAKAPPHISLKLSRITVGMVISGTFYVLLLWLFYMIFTQKALFNPYETLVVKFGVKNPAFSFFDYSFETKFFLFLFYIIAPVKLFFFLAMHTKFRNFSILITLFTVGAYFTISRNSVERVNQITPQTYREQVDFVVNTVMPLFFGTRSIPAAKYIEPKDILIFLSIFTFPLTSLLITLYKSLKSFIRTRTINIDLIDVFSLYLLIPILFFLSRTGGVTGSSRYITNMWPGFIVLYIYGFYKLVKTKNFILILISTFLITFFCYSKFPLYKEAFLAVRNRTLFQTDQIKAADYLVKKGVKSAYAGYWNAYPIMFASKYKVIVSPSGYFGYGENETPFNTAVVDANPNPAFIFTTQKRVDEFYSKWVNRNIQVLKSERVGEYYIFLTNRIN